ncbi:hypothetical protein MGYG_02578 [Nannizzia gypsea CBS 118893]|uniref:Uncharacterized protein n=1 Tax=Arthroderma gypseum (strain ATCC MYA-4604 / CBS 118893) TaxID=535722 RepID=E4UNA5_ARTGP|nr:hypothetical protein MGYG_02578 [Nannizzia gypsea CBS 118893]EFQ99566.1 hypothetical protein MGYG_02578 [Nannizzia gypsea CBS 118893]
MAQKTRQAMYKNEATKQGNAERRPDELEVVGDAEEVGVDVEEKGDVQGFDPFVRRFEAYVITSCGFGPFFTLYHVDNAYVVKITKAAMASKGIIHGLIYYECSDGAERVDTHSGPV